MQATLYKSLRLSANFHIHVISVQEIGSWIFYIGDLHPISFNHTPRAGLGYEIFQALKQTFESATRVGRQQVAGRTGIWLSMADSGQTRRFRFWPSQNDWVI